MKALIDLGYWRNLTRVLAVEFVLCLKGVFFGNDWIVYIEALIYWTYKYLLAFGYNFRVGGCLRR